ncbi:MAG: glycosyltransferase [Ilumatobacteraceae bacterium]
MRHHPDKRGVVSRAIRKLASRAPRKAVRIVRGAPPMSERPPAPAPVRVFVAPTGNGHGRKQHRELALSRPRRSPVASARLVDDSLPTADGSLDLVVAPHEFFELFDAPKAALQRAAAVSVCVCTEQPDTPWFHLSVDACRRGVVSLDINPVGTAALRSVGVDARHLRLGGVPSLAVPTHGDRPIDVLFLGGLDDRRGAALAELAPRLYRHRNELRLFRFDRPVTPATPGVVFGADKSALLASARLLVNLHRDRRADLPAGTVPPAYFEWARMIEAMANGCVVVTEPSEGFEPLVPGVHFVEATPDAMADAIDDLLADHDRRNAIAAAARTAVMDELSMVHEVRRARRTRTRRTLASGRTLRRPIRPRDCQAPRRHQGDAAGTARAVPPREGSAAAPSRWRWRRTALRRLDRVACVLAHGTEQHVERAETAAYAGARPEVGVLVTLYNYADVVTETLASIVASEDVAFEVIVVDDHATDASRDVVRTFLAAHPEVPMVLLGKDANEGLAAARNTGFAEARADLVMVMDADNHVYPTALRRLADALLAAPDASATYSILEDFGAQRNVRSALAWDVDRLCHANYIDAQAMWRRDAWRELGGYRADDDHVYGWEDWDLWLRLAERGGRATLVPQILGRYRVQAGSMIALTNLATDDAITAIRGRYPTLPWRPFPSR